MFQKLRYHIIALSVILLALVYSISSLAIYGIVSRTVMQALDLELTVAAHQTMNTNRPKLNPPGVTTLIENAPSDYTVEGRVGENETGLIADVKHAVENQKNAHGSLNISVGDRYYRVQYIFLKTNETTSSQPFQPFLSTFVEDTGELDVLSHLRRVLLLVGLFGLGGTSVAGFFLAGRMLRPIKSAWKRQLEFVSDASHELRTPLAVIQSNLGIVMEHTDETVINNLEWLNNIHGESRRLAKLVQNLLTLARSDSEKMPISQDELEMGDVIEHVHELYQTVCEIKGITLRIEAGEEVLVLGDGDRLHQLLVILLDNALKFTDPGGSITMQVARVKNRAVVSVIDTGQGIAHENLGRVFERFFTVDRSRSHETAETGTGLGLPIAKWIVNAHGGSIHIESAGLGQGATVRVELPIRAA